MSTEKLSQIYPNIRKHSPVQLITVKNATIMSFVLIIEVLVVSDVVYLFTLAAQILKYSKKLENLTIFVAII